ncbi:MAG: radical SAM protein [Nannocystis sp.]|nr:radical SAM protein [Nannocystis sp.]
MTQVELQARGVAFKAYYMITSRCNLDCEYCVLEDAPHQLRGELDLEGKIALIHHLYHRLGFRRLTLSGGEALLIGKRPPEDFLRLVDFLRGLRSPDPTKNLEIGLYTNASLLDDRVADAMVGVVDLVAITIDSKADGLLRKIGRSTRGYPDYFRHAVEACGRLSRRGIRVKLHSVVGQLNHERIGDEVRPIYDAVTEGGGRLAKWKFYQYMSYDDPTRDRAHAIDDGAYARAAGAITRALEGTDVPLHFKDNGEMNDSLFNILHYGNAQYMRPGDTWSTSQRTRDLREYGSMQELFAAHDVDEEAFRRHHELVRPFGGGA